MHVIVEAPFMHSHWCSHYLKGITAQAKRKNMDISVHTKYDFAAAPDFKDSHVIVVGSSLTWASHMLNLLYADGIRPIVLGVANYQKTFPFATFITMDYDDASLKLMKYLRDKGCKRTAFFAGSLKSSTDMQKMSNFLCSGGSESDVFHYAGSLKETGDRLLARIGDFDSILCANDVSAVVLMRRLLDMGYKIPGDLEIATFGDTMLSSLKIRNIAVARVKSSEAGKLAISAYRMLQSNPSISAMTMLLHCDILDAEYEPVEIHLQPTVPTFDAHPSTNFFHDPDVQKVLLVEKLLSGCDKLDIAILREVLIKESYSKIAAKLFIAENTISYRIKMILDMAPEKPKEEIFELLAQFLF